MSRIADWKPAAPAAAAPGLTLLEASAGTGKTYSITSLLLRLVAEKNLKMREIVVVTFTRAATAEVKDRIRLRLAQAVSVLEGRSTLPAGDEILTHLLRGAEQPEGRAWLRRLQAAQESFDECLISTIHGFCQRMLQQNAFESQTDFDLQLVEDTSGLRDELVDDYLSRSLHAEDRARYQFLVEGCGFTEAGLTSLADLALRDPDMDVLPAAQDLAAGWSAAVAAFTTAWNGGWSTALPDMYEAAHKRGVFGGAQRTYRKTSCAKKAAEVTAWLRDKPVPIVPPFVLDYWEPGNVVKFIADGRDEPGHEGLAALRELLRWHKRAVGVEKATFVRWLRLEFDRRMGARRSQSYQDLMRNLARVLRDRANPGRDALIGAMGGRFKAALIDEFQDTDSLQWTIFREVFGDEAHRLYLIGDPKQAIYGFRGANVHVYLAAKRATTAERLFTIRRNFRSDTRLLEAFNLLLDKPGFFGEAGIDYVPVEGAPRPGVPDDRMRHRTPWTEPFAAPLQVRFIDRRLAGAASVSEQDKAVGKGLASALLPRRVADDIVEHLEAGIQIFDPEHDRADGQGFRPLGPGDFAVLTRTGRQAVQVQAALSAAGIASVLQGADSVLASDEAFDLQLWLEALASPGHDGPARTAATTRLFGRSGTLLSQVEAQEPEALRQWEEWLTRLAQWRAGFAEHGFLHTLRTALQDDLLPAPDAEREREDVATRVLRRPDGDRRMTNLWHVAELLHAAQVNQRLQLAGLLAWLKRERVDSTVDSTTAELRLDRDDEAVALMTMHKAKGLEFPVVFVPYLWDGKGPREDAPLVVPDEQEPERRLLDLRVTEEARDTRARAVLESDKEQLRLLYVALTRARLRCVLYTGHISGLSNAPLAPALHGDPPNDRAGRIETGRARAETASRDDLWSDLVRLVRASATALPDGAPTMALTACERPQGRVWAPPCPPALQLRARDFSRFGLDHTWRRHSYSSIAHGKTVVYLDPGGVQEGFDPDADGAEPPSREAPADDRWVPRYDDIPPDAPDVALAGFPSGADAGTFLHAVFEKSDFRWAHPDGGTGDGKESLRALIAGLLPQHGFGLDPWSGMLVRGLVDVLQTPLGSRLGDVRLCDIPREARLDELRFDFPIAGGNAYGKGAHLTRVPPDGIARALRVREGVSPLHGSDEQTMREAYLRGLPTFNSLAGFMTGSIDMVFRHPVDGHPQWFVVDYKSNRLDPRRTGKYPARHFCFEGMRYEMERNHYYVQYHLYVLALHRYLRFRLGAQYDYEKDMGGVYYLFFRGMQGPGTTSEGRRRHGCFYDKPPFAVIEALDRLFSGVAEGAAGGAS